MEIKLNGKIEKLEKKISVKELLENLEKQNKVDLSGAVILLNEEIVKKTEWEKVLIEDRDTVEVLSFVSGG